MIGELFSGPERKPIGYILSNSKSLIYLVSVCSTKLLSSLFPKRNKINSRTGMVSTYMGDSGSYDPVLNQPAVEVLK